jgi:hypothetical protein
MGGPILLCLPYFPPRSPPIEFLCDPVDVSDIHNNGVPQMPDGLCSASPASTLPTTALLAAAGPIRGVSALVLAHSGLRSLEVLCDLIAQGCGAAAEMPPDGKVPVEPAEIVIVPNPASRSDVQAALALAQRALLPCGRIVFQDDGGDLCRDIVGMLHGAGYCKIRVQAHRAAAIISADKPMFGPILRSAGHA